MVKVNDYEVVEGLYYSTDFAWVHVENGKARIGITDYAQKQMREIVFAEIPSVGDTIQQNEPYGTVESVKAVSDLVAPLNGTVEEVNEEIESRPEILNEEPYTEGWILLISPSDLETEIKELMDFNAAVTWHRKISKED